MFEDAFRWLTAAGLEDSTAVWVARYGMILLAILVTVVLFFFVIRRQLISRVTTLSQRSETSWDDALLQPGF